jgi:hypothetical protein
MVMLPLLPLLPLLLLLLLLPLLGEPVCTSYPSYYMACVQAPSSS